MEQKPPVTARQLAGMFDHTLLKPYVTDEEFRTLCADADRFGFCMVAINSAQTALCRGFLKESPVHVGAAISFPLGQTTIESKVFETKDAIANGADEIDYVVNLVQLKNGNDAYLEEDMRAITELCREHGVISKVIFENCYLTQEEKLRLCAIASRVKPDFIKTSTGFGAGGATVEDVRLMRENTDPQVKVKAAGGIRDLDACLAMIGAGAERIGTSSSIRILEEYRERFGD